MIETLISLNMKMNVIERYLKLILNKQSVPNPVSNVEKEEEDDIFNNLPLKNENELQALETKLSNDSTYKKHMVSYICLLFNIK